MAGSPSPDRDRAEEITGSDLEFRVRCFVTSARYRSVRIIAILLLISVVAFARPDGSLKELISQAEKAPNGDRPTLYTQIAERQLQTADALYSTGQSDAAKSAVDDVVTYSDKACEATSQARGKIKSTEIAIRKMAAKLRDIKRSVAFEDQEPVQVAADHLEKLRTGLLSQMFSKGH
jgi:hypothetical protein